MGSAPKRLAVAVVIAVSYLVATTGPAAAYIDPGSGSYLLQLLVGAFLGASAAIAVFWRRIVGFFKRGSSSNETGTADKG